MKSIPKILQNHILPFNWNVENVWHLKAETKAFPISEFSHLLELPFWSSIPNSGMLFDISPIEVLNNPSRAPHQTERINKSQTKYPLDFINYKNRLWVLDGIHRLAKLYREKSESIKVRVHSEESIPKIKVIKSIEKPSLA